MSLALIIPTLGRPTLERTLMSVIFQVRGLDQVIVVGDGDQPGARRIVDDFPGVEYHETPAPTRCWGHAQRNLGMQKAWHATHLAFLDDDDLWMPGARGHLEDAMRRHPDRPVFFRMRHQGRILWQKPELAPGNVSTQMFLFPADPGRLASWGPDPSRPRGMGGDYLFARDTVALYPPGTAVFLEPVVAVLLHHSRGNPASTG